MGFGYFSGFSILFMLVFLFVFGMIVYIILRNAKQWHHNNQSPRLSVMATIVSRRTYVGRHAGNDSMAPGYTRYYATFQVESGDRMELEIPYSQYGYLVEGDNGKLTFQGSRFIGFERS